MGMVARSDNDLTTGKARIPDTANYISKGMFLDPKGRPLKM